MPNVLIDWEGLARSFQQPDLLDFNTPYPMRVGSEYDRTPGKGVTELTQDGLKYDVSGLWNSFKFNKEDWDAYWKQQQLPVQIDRDKEGFNVFNFAFNTLPNFIGDTIIDTAQFMQNPYKSLQRSYLEKVIDDPGTQLEYAKLLKDRLPQFLANNDPNLIEEIGMGTEEGSVQNVNLLLGSEAKSFNTLKLEATDKAITKGYEAGLVSAEDYAAYKKWRQEWRMNTSLAFDVTAGLTNSLLIMGELAATGGIASIDMAGIKFFSTQGLKTYGKGILKQGINTWKLMGAGANIKAMGDAIDTTREENLDASEFIVELGRNAFKENLSAFAEGASEGVLWGLKLGSVPIKKWLGSEIEREVGGKIVKQFMTKSEMQGLLKATTDQNVVRQIQRALRQLPAERKEIVKMIEKNVGKKLVNGLFMETATEQLTDLLQDAFEKESHASILNLFSDDPEHRDEAFRNLVVEASVGMMLGVSVGLGEIWSRKPLQELREKYGDDIANQIETKIKDPGLQQAAAQILVDNGRISTNPDIANTEGTAKVMLDLGSKQTKLYAGDVVMYTDQDGSPQEGVVTNDSDFNNGIYAIKATTGYKKGSIQNTDRVLRIIESKGPEGKATQQARINLPVDVADVVQTVDNMEAPNVLDFVMQLGQKQIKQVDTNIANQVTDIAINPVPSNFLTESSPEILHHLTEHGYQSVLNEALNRGLMDRISWVKEGEIELKRDLAVGIALNFDDLGWGYVRHKYSTNSDIDFAIEEAQKLAKSNIMIEPTNDLSKRLYPKSALKDIQGIARLAFIKGLSDAKAMALGERASIITGQVEYIPGTELESKEPETPLMSIEGGFAEYTGDIEGFGDFSETEDPTGQRFQDVERPPYMAVALRGEDGTLYHGAPGEHRQHADLIYGPRSITGALRASTKGVYGYVNWDGKFESRDEVNYKWGYKDDEGYPVYVGESFKMFEMGLLPKTGTRFENIPDVTFKLPTYDSVLPKVEESTFSELAKHLEEKGLSNELTKEVMDKILPIIGNRKVLLREMSKEHAGGTNINTLESTLNTKAPMFKSTSPYDTLVHEGLHSWLMLFMDSQADLAKKFKGQIRGVMNTVRSVLNSADNADLIKERWMGSVQELMQYKSVNNAMIRKALLNEEEFLSSVFSDTQAMKYLTDRILISGPTRKLTGWKRIWNSIGGVLKKEATVPHTATQKLKESLEDFNKTIVGLNLGLNKQFNVALARENKRLASNISSGFQEWEEYDDGLEDDLDDYQVLDDIPNEDESKVENQTINNFVAFMGKAMNTTEAAYREYIRQTPYKQFLTEMKEFDEKNNTIITRKLQRMYSGYKHIWPTFNTFRRQFLKRQYLNIINKSAKVSAIMVASSNYDPVMGQTENSYEVRLVKGSYVDGKGAKRNTYRETIALESFIPEFERALGLDAGTFHVVFLDGFESIREGRTIRRNSFDRLRPEYFFDYKKQEPMTGHLADWLWSNSANTGSPYNYLYLGNFAKKNTLPVLAFEATKGKEVRQALEQFEALYANAAVEQFGSVFKAENKESRRMAATARALLETLWFKKDLQDPSIAAQDWNKIMKRGTKWLVKDTKIILTAEEVKERFGNRDLSGTKLLGNDAELRAAVINSTDNRVITLNLMGQDITVPLSDLLLNELGTPIGDGSSVYIIGQFDELYSTAHGALKSGIIKNVYASRVNEVGTFIKHAMHGVHRDSILGQWMINNDLALLVFDESMKEGKDHYTPIGGIEFQDKAAWNEVENTAKGKGQEVIATLKLSRFQRIKEIENRDTLGFSTKQIVNGTAFSDLYNKALKEAQEKAGVKTSLNDILIDFSNAQTQQAVKWFQRNSTPFAKLDLLRNIIAEPKSPLEESVSNIWGNLLEPKEGQDDEDLLNKYGGAFDHAHTAEALRNRLQHRMAQLLGGKTSGMRGGLSPNFGYLNHKRDVEPITQQHNLADIMINEMDPAPRDVLEGALPEPGLLTLVRKLQDTGRAESRAHNDYVGHDLKRRIDSLQKYRVKLIRQIRALESPRLNSIITEGSTKISIHRLINWSHPSVVQWQNEVIFGKIKEDNGVQVRDESGILNVKHGRLRRTWKLLPEDIANKLAVRPGDWVMDVITPTDSPLGVTAFRVAAITKVNEDGTGRKVSDRNAIVLNSEWSQSLNGKDHDADDVSTGAYHPDFWKLKNFQDLIRIGQKIPAAYTKAIKEETVKLLNQKNTVIKTDKGDIITTAMLEDPSQTERLIFGEPMVKEKYTVLLNGAPSQVNSRVFPIAGQSFIQLDTMYLHSPAPIINERLYHTGSSAINLRAKQVPLVLITKDGRLASKGSIDGEEVEFVKDLIVRNNTWMRTNINHQAATHANVDFPNNTSLLAFNSDPMVWASQFWGLHDDPMAIRMGELLRPLYQALRNFQKLLFEDAFNLARRRDTDLFEKLGYFETIEQLKRAKSRLSLLANNDKQGLKNLYRDLYNKQVTNLENKFRAGTPEHATGLLGLKQQLVFIEGFIDRMETDDIYQYPLFNTIKNLSLNAIPDIGNTYKDHLINQVVATGESIAMFPEVHERYKTAIQKAPMSFFIVGESAAEKVAKNILKMLGAEISKNSRKQVETLMRNSDRLQRFMSRARPSSVNKIKELLGEFQTLNAKIGQPYEPYYRAGQAINVDGETIAFSRIPRELDWYQGRANRASTQNTEEYWNKQLRMAREEAVTMMHAFDVEPAIEENRSKLPEHTEERRIAHQRVYPIMWKQILQSPFLFFNTHSEAVTLTHPEGVATLTSSGRGEIMIDFNGKTYKHTELKAEDRVYQLLTERNGFWEGISDTSTGTNNRANMRKLIRMARNLSMDTRYEMVKNFLVDRLYGSETGFDTTDQVGFWLSLISQTSFQAMQDNKAKGFIVNQSAYDPKRPMKYQNNHLALDLMSVFEESLIDGWMQLYSHANKQKERMVYEDQPVMGPQEALRHYFSSYRDNLNEVSKDSDFVSFYKSMRNKDWKDGLEALRKLVKSTVLLKALSENGVYYDDLVRDLNTLTNTQFFNKYKGVDVEDINLSIERYMGRQTVDQFVRQHAGEDAVEFRTRGTIIALYWSLNGAKKLEKKREAKLGKIGRYLSSFIGYDMVALLGEKKTHALTARDEEISFFLDLATGSIPVTAGDVQITMKPQPTRTWLPIGESTIAQAKTKHANQQLIFGQTNLNDQVRLFEDVIKLTSDPNYRGKFKEQYSHRKKGEASTPHTSRSALISRLLDLIPEEDSKQIEIARKEIFELAEGLRDRGKIWIEEINGEITYNIQLNKVYRYKNLEDLISNHLQKATPQKKLQLIGALDMRYMYDILVPKYLDSVLRYLTESRDRLNAATSFTQALNVEATIRKYMDIRDSLLTRKGNYMPHMFPESEFRLLWLDGFMNHEIDRIKYEISEAKKTGNNPVLAGLDPEKDAQAIHDMAFERADDEYNKISHDWQRGSVIPNFLPRQFEHAKGYTKTDPTIHFNYITRLIEGLKKDVLKADWYMYQQQAREAGERTSVMELTRQWYAKQINDEELNSELIKSDRVKPGMNVSFNQRTFLIRNNDPSLTVGTGIVSGVVRKVTADEVTLDLDTDRIRWEIKQDLKRWTNISDKIALVAKTSKASNRQIIVLQNLLLKGYLTNEDFTGMDMSQLSMLDAADLAIRGLRRAYKDPAKMTRFKWTEIWAQDVRGERVDGHIRRYARGGALESLRTRGRELHNLQIMAGRYDGAIPVSQYRLIKGAITAIDWWRKGMKRTTSLLYMGMASAFKARVVNQVGATINNLIDAPKYNLERWRRGMEIWDRIKHGKVELMDPDDAKLYKTLVSLGLTEDNSLLAIALEAANIKPEDMLIQEAKPAAIKWLMQTWQDAVGYKEVAKKFQDTKEKILKTADPKEKMRLTMTLDAEKKIWQAKIEGILNSKNPTEAEKVAAWKKIEQLAQEGKLTKLNIAAEQGIDLGMATRLAGSVAWKSFYTSNLGVGFQAKAERLRIPAFFIGYTTALDMGFTEDEAIQFGINSIELRHALYGAASKQFGANTEMGTLLFQYSQYQYNALSKMFRILHEAIPQMLRFAHNRPEEVNRIKHLGNMFKLIQTSTDAKGKALKRGEVTLKEINLLHGIMMKGLWTGIMMQLGTRIFYGMTNFQDPVGQTLYRTIDYLITLLQSGFDPGDDDDKERLAWAIQDGALVAGLLYKYQLQALEALTSTEDGLGKTFADTFVKGRAEDTFNFLWRTHNTAHQIAYELGVTDDKRDRKQKTYFDVPWLTDQVFTGIKIMGYSPADNEPDTFDKQGFFGTRTVNSFTAGRYVETEGKGITGFGEGRTRSRFSYLFDPLSYVPFLDRMITGK